MTPIELHDVTINPLTVAPMVGPPGTIVHPYSGGYEVVCSQLDLRRVVDDLTEAKEIAYGHLNNLHLNERNRLPLDLSNRIV